MPNLRFYKGTLILQGFDADVNPNHLFKKGRFIWHSDLQSWQVPAFDYPKLLPLPAGIDDQVPNWRPKTSLYPKMPDLRDYQVQAKECWLPTKRGIVVLPTGAGKTELALSLMADLSVPTLVICPTRDLMYQWSARIEKNLGFRPGIIGDQTFELKDISVTTYHSACRKMDHLGNQYPFLIFDECHHLPGTVRSDAARMSAAPYRLGLSATPPIDLREAVVRECIGPVVFKRNAREVSVLAEYQVIRLTVELSQEERKIYDECGIVVRDYFTEQRKEDPDFEWEDIYGSKADSPRARAAYLAHRKRKSIEDRAVEKMAMLEDLFRDHPRVPTIVFTGSNVNAREIAKRFLIPYILSECGRDERFQVLDGFRSGEFPAIVANQVLDEGIDIPQAKVAIILGGMASMRQATQRLGRILRKDGNVPATLYEIVCEDTGEVTQSRKRRKADAYQKPS